MARHEACRGDRPVDPGLPEPGLPALRGSPGRDEKRAGHTPRSEISSIAPAWSGPEYRGGLRVKMNLELRCPAGKRAGHPALGQARELGARKGLRDAKAQRVSKQ